MKVKTPAVIDPYYNIDVIWETEPTEFIPFQVWPVNAQHSFMGLGTIYQAEREAKFPVEPKL